MALQRMILVPTELWEKRSQSPPPPVNKILKSNDHRNNNWTQVRLQQDPYLKKEKRKREPIPIPIIDTGGPNPSFATKPKRKRVIGSVPLFKEESLAESESETDSVSVHSKYIDNVLKRKGSHDSTFGVYQDDTATTFKIGRTNFKCNDKHVFVDGKNYKATPGLWELLSRSKPDKDLVTLHDRQTYKQILLQSNDHRVNYSPTDKIRANKGLKYTQFISRPFTERQVPW
jgi:hypothetical protein